MALPAKVYFDVGAATIGVDGGSTIAEVARIINRDGLRVAVTGYTDRSGDIAMNEELAKNRASAVVDALKAADISGYARINGDALEEVRLMMLEEARATASLLVKVGALG